VTLDEYVYPVLADAVFSNVLREALFKTAVPNVCVAVLLYVTLFLYWTFQTINSVTHYLLL
jgi:hypothetical protein